jgi:hypothetical protein
MYYYEFEPYNLTDNRNSTTIKKSLVVLQNLPNDAERSQVQSVSRISGKGVIFVKLCSIGCFEYPDVVQQIDGRP